VFQAKSCYNIFVSLTGTPNVFSGTGFYEFGFDWLDSSKYWSVLGYDSHMLLRLNTRSRTEMLYFMVNFELSAAIAESFNQLHPTVQSNQQLLIVRQMRNNRVAREKSLPASTLRLNASLMKG
jgi:hypothetical protein